MRWGQVWGSHIWDLDSWWVSSCGVTAARVSLLLLIVGAAGHWESLGGQIRGSVRSPGLTSAFCILWLKPQPSASAGGAGRGTQG